MFLALAIVVVSLVLLETFVKQQRYKKDAESVKLKPLPGPPNLPFVGCLPFLLPHLINFLPNYEKMTLVANRWGKFFKAHLGVQSCVYVEDFEIAREIMASDDWFNRFNDHPSFYERSFNKQIGLATGNGVAWKEVRRFTVKNLRDLGFGKGISMEAGLNLELDTLLCKMSSLMRRNEDVVDMNLFFNVSVLNLLWRMLVGDRFSHEDVKLQKLLKLVDKASKSAPQGLTPVFVFPVLRYIPGLTEQDIILELHRQVQALFKDIIEKRREVGLYKDDPQNFVDVFLQQIHDNRNNPNSPYTDEQLIMVCTDLFFTGSDTSSTALEFALMYLILNPEVQVRLQDEIDAVIGTDRLPTLDDRKDMPYTEATILEVLRVSTVLPITARTTVRDIDFHGYLIPKGTTAGINLHAMHHSPDMWDNPRQFNPDRFLDNNNQLVNTDKIMPFGCGKRVCMGETTARATIFMFLTGLLQKYSFKTSPVHGPPSTKPICGFTQYPRPYKAQVSLRSTR